MNLNKSIIFLVLFLIIFGSFCQYDDIIQKLSQKISGLQVQKSTTIHFPFEWEKQKGIYESWVHLNAHGNIFMQTIRNDLKFFDDNFFVTAWINQILLEANKIGKIQLDKDQLLNGVLVDDTYLDHNSPGVPIINFWPERLVDGKWMSYPINLVVPTEDEESFGNAIHKLLDFLGLDSLWKYIEPYISFASEALAAFHIPPDADDTSVNLAMGCLLYENKDKFPDAFNAWWSSNKNISRIMDYIIQYAYYPLMNDNNLDVIDSRTYYFMHEFLESGVVKDKSFGLVATWLMNQITSKNGYPNEAMPFNMNNVDASVCSNFIYGLSQLSVSQLIPLNEWISDEIKNLFVNTATYVNWVIQTGRLLERPDLGILYYPPIYDMYWFVSRTLSLFSGNSFPDPIFETVYNMFLSTMENEGTAQILKAVQEDSNNAWWDDFLGDNDTNLIGKHVNNAEDRIFTTSIAMNALIDTWTIRNDYKYTWRQETPEYIKDIIQKGINWLVKYSISSTYKPENCFFSGSGKSVDGMPFWYPATYIEYLNGTVVPPDSPPSVITNELIDAMSGILSSDDYNHMVYDELHFQSPTPTNFTGFNTGSFFPYWSSPALTYSTTLLAISKYSTITQSENKN
ncbi:hypothetical protein M0811_00549 [Anaeramoeba ignava]|uniref:Uncharacterized protein n=1 Tax=Anaeramoeba ignava TaxID=1746090 RepID=A0A9Q0REL9_ANAIG|nr:hypothetical protein M0811_00549 [Anaeramoeba ignava]